MGSGFCLIRYVAISMLFIVVVSTQVFSTAAAAPRADRPVDHLSYEVRQELITLPYYSIFDNLSFIVSGDTVTLLGDVTRPTLKSSAENVVNDIEGVNNVKNNIEVLPLSFNDDRIRRAEYRAIYSQPVLNKYALRAVPTIHIIVKNGHVKLEGAVANAGDKNIAGIQARTVPGVFSVTNNLRVDSAG
jgi:hyperosmotically inducible protein